MSFILDALRKLERERPSGPVPDLHTVHGPASKRPGRSALRIGIAAAAVLAGAVALLVWLGPRRSTTASAPAPEEAGRARSATSGEPRAKVAPLVVVSSSPAPPREVGSPKQPPGGPGPAFTGGATAQAGSEADEPVVWVTPGSDVAAPGEPPAGPYPGSAPSALEPAVKEAGVTGVNGSGAAAYVSPASAPVAAPAAESTPPASPVTAPAVPKEILELQVSGHIYSEDARMRMIVVGNRVLREGDPIDAGLRVDEITAEGALISLRGVSYTVKMPGR